MMYYTELGYDEYDKFLVGPEWRGLNKYFYEHRASYECNICGTHQGLVLHKRSYRFLSLADLKKKYRGNTTKIMRYLHTYMVYLCRQCHRKVHFLPSGERTPMQYQTLKDRELRLKKAAQHNGKPVVKVSQPKSKSSFLGSYFKSIIKQK